MKILMVCIGNICRSPIAEGIMQKLIEEHGLDWSVDSAAIASYHIGSPPHASSQKVCLERGIDISRQKARLFKKEDLKHFDKIYAMEEAVLKQIKKACNVEFDSGKIMLFLNELNPGGHASVPDPWYGDEKDYYPVYDLIESVCKKIVAKYASV